MWACLHSLARCIRGHTDADIVHGPLSKALQQIDGDCLAATHYLALANCDITALGRGLLSDPMAVNGT